MVSLLIRGASLPKDKEQIYVIFPDGVVNVVERGTPYYEAVEVPYHGDLIDRDELLKKCQEWGYSPRQIKEADTIIPASKEVPE